MYKDFYENEIKKISKILAKDNIHIIKIWTNFQKYIYDVSDERNICTDLVLILDKNPKFMKVITLEKIKNYMEFNPKKPECFSLQSQGYENMNDAITYDFYKYDSKGADISIRIEYAKENDYEDFDIEIDKGNPLHDTPIMIYTNDKITDLENEFNVDLSSEKFNLISKEKTIKKSWIENYSSPIFGKYELKFIIYEQTKKFTIEITNSLTNKIYKPKNNFSSYNAALEWAKTLSKII